MPSQHLYGLAVNGVHNAYRTVPVGQVHDVVGNENTVGEGESAVAPAFQKIPVPIEYNNGRILALEGKNPALRVAGDGANHGKIVACW